MEHEQIDPKPAQGEQSQEQQERKTSYPLIGSEGEVSGYDWD